MVSGVKNAMLVSLFLILSANLAKGQTVGIPGGVGLSCYVIQPQIVDTVLKRSSLNLNVPRVKTSESEKILGQAQLYYNAIAHYSSTIPGFDTDPSKNVADLTFPDSDDVSDSSYKSFTADSRKNVLYFLDKAFDKIIDAAKLESENPTIFYNLALVYAYRYHLTNSEKDHALAYTCQKRAETLEEKNPQPSDPLLRLQPNGALVELLATYDPRKNKSLVVVQ